MPPGSDKVIDMALLSSWEAGLIALVILALVGTFTWAFVFAVRRTFGEGGYKERTTKAEERVANRQIQFIEYMSASQTSRDELCGRHAAAIEKVANGVRTQDQNTTRLCDAIAEQTAILRDSDGISGVGKRLEASAAELAQVALELFEESWDDLSSDAKQKVRDKIELVRKRHARGGQ